MYIDGTGSVNGGNGNEAWFKQLAKILDKADGEDGKIKADTWNVFLKESHARKINYFIKLDRAEISFNYYKSKKDVGNDKVDWSNWKQMLNVYLDKIGKPELKVDEDTPVQDTSQETESKTVEPCQKQAVQGQENGDNNSENLSTVYNALKNSKLETLKKFGEEELAPILDGFEQAEPPQDAPDDTDSYVNSETGERIDIIPNSDGTGLLVYKHDNESIEHRITFEPNSGKLISGEIVCPDSENLNKTITVKYKYDDNGNIDNLSYKDVELEEASSLPATQDDLQNAVNSFSNTMTTCKLDTDTLPTEAKLIAAGFNKGESKDGKTTFTKDDETITISDNPKIMTYQKDGVLIIQEYGENGQPKPMKVAIKGEDGTFATGVCKQGDDGSLTVELKQSHKAPETKLESFAEAVEAYQEEINNFRTGIQFNPSPDLRIDLTKDIPQNENPKEIVSQDGNYKIKVEIDESGNLKVTYYQKQIGGEDFKELGTLTLTKFEDLSTLRGYNYKFVATGKESGRTTIFQKIDWKDFE